MKKSTRRPPGPEGARKGAWRILLDWDEGGEALEALRDRYFASSRPHRRDRSLITELTQGTVRHLTFLDHCVYSCLDRPGSGDLPQPVLWALRIGVYQLVHLHKIPSHAAVTQSVQIIKDSRFRGFTSLVNAILRRIARSGPPLVPGFDDDPLHYLELSTSTPRWLVEALVRQAGLDETRLLLQALNRTPPLTLRTNTLRTTREGLLEALAKQNVTASPGKLAGTAVLIEDRTPPWELEPFLRGWCTVQDEGAQLIAPLLGPLPGHRILDACAAPGGKTAHLAQLTGGRGLVVAADRSLQRVRMMPEVFKRLRVPGIRLVAGDLGTAASPFAGNAFDRILLDVPCSGTGVLRRHPEGKWKKDPETIALMARVQLDLLLSSARSLKGGGRLLYTTCSLLTEENEEVVDRFLSRNQGFVRADMREEHPAMPAGLFTDRGELRLWPHRHGCDGFFACLMEKRD